MGYTLIYKKILVCNKNVIYKCLKIKKLYNIINKKQKKDGAKIMLKPKIIGTVERERERELHF